MDLTRLNDYVAESLHYITERIKLKPEIGIILGSGLGSVADEITQKTTLSYGDIPNFPVSLTEGHPGFLQVGYAEQKGVAVMQGRIHFHEGYSMASITLPIRVMKELGIKTMLLTNAAGGLDPQFRPGDLMLITDHINLMGTNPLMGLSYPKSGTKFLDMSEAYSKDLVKLAEDVARAKKIEIYRGVYVAVAGPVYETPAEVKTFTRMGADAVGMSTVPETIVCKELGIRVLGISCITNVLAGAVRKHAHQDILEVANVASKTLAQIIKGVLKKL